MSKPKKVKTSSDENLVSETTGDQTLEVALDTEYQRNDNTTYSNKCLSYQMAGKNLAIGEHKEGIYYPEHQFDVRLRFAQVLEWIFSIFGIHDKDI